MSYYLLNATRRISNREPNTPITKRQLFNMLIDYGAFKDSSILKFAVKNVIFEVFWTQAANIYNDTNRDRNAINILKQRVKMTFGYADVIINTVFDSIWNSQEWTSKQGSEDVSYFLHFEGIPITGSSFTFMKKLLPLGFSWNIYKRCFEGIFHGIDDCEIRINDSNSEVPLFYLTVTLPSSITEEIANSLRRKLIELERNRNPSMYFSEGSNIDNIHSLIDPGTISPSMFIRLKKDKLNNNYMITFVDGTGQGIMVESCLYCPHNNLATID